MSPRRHHEHDSEDAEDPRRQALETGAGDDPNSLVVGMECRSMNLYRFLRVRFPQRPHGELKSWIDDQKITVNGEAVTDSRPLRFGDVVAIDAELDLDQPTKKAIPTALSVLHSDAALFAIDKPAGLATAGERSTRTPHLLGLLKSARPEANPKLVHRIDKQASGVVIFACGRDAKRALHEEFGARRVTKDYLALVSGHVDDAPIKIEAPLMLRNGRPQRMVVSESRGKASVTWVRALLRFRGFTLVHARPVTGRTHQIRVHLRHLGHALVGDALYDGAPELRLSEIKYRYRPGRGESERPLLARLALHAFRIRLTSPADGATITVTAPLPKDLRSAIKQLQKGAATRVIADMERFLADPIAAVGVTDDRGEAIDPFAAEPPPPYTAAP